MTDPINIKCVLIGNAEVGKTSMLKRYTSGSYSDSYTPTVFDNYSKEVTHKGNRYTLGLWDTSGMPAYDRMRQMSYKTVDIFVICFSLIDEESFSNVRPKWAKEAKAYFPNAPVLIVGTKHDLREDEYTVQDLRDINKNVVSRKQGIVLAKDVSAKKYMECSADTEYGLNALFDEVVKLYVSSLKKEGCCKCIIL